MDMGIREILDYLGCILGSRIGHCKVMRSAQVGQSEIETEQPVLQYYAELPWTLHGRLNTSHFGFQCTEFTH